MLAFERYYVKTRRRSSPSQDTTTRDLSSKSCQEVAQFLISTESGRKNKLLETLREDCDKFFWVGRFQSEECLGELLLASVLNCKGQKLSADLVKYVTSSENRSAQYYREVLANSYFLSIESSHRPQQFGILMKAGRENALRLFKVNEISKSGHLCFEALFENGFLDESGSKLDHGTIVLAIKLAIKSSLARATKLFRKAESEMNALWETKERHAHDKKTFSEPGMEDDILCTLLDQSMAHIQLRIDKASYKFYKYAIAVTILQSLKVEAHLEPPAQLFTFQYESLSKSDFIGKANHEKFPQEQEKYAVRIIEQLVTTLDQDIFALLLMDLSRPLHLFKMDVHRDCDTFEKENEVLGAHLEPLQPIPDAVIFVRLPELRYIVFGVVSINGNMLPPPTLFAKYNWSQFNIQTSLQICYKCMELGHLSQLCSKPYGHWLKRDSNPQID